MNLRERFFIVGDTFFRKLLNAQLSDCKSVLDVGCGSNSVIGTFPKIFYSEGIDIYEPSIKESKRRKIHAKYIVGDILDIDEYYKEKSFEAVIALDVVEHLEKKDARMLLKKMEKIAEKRIIILTPNGFIQQGDHKDNPYQKHKSGWSRRDFEKEGYVVYGLRSFKFLRGELAIIKLKPWLIWGLFAFITEPLLYYFPDLSFDLFAIKNKD